MILTHRLFLLVDALHDGLYRHVARLRQELFLPLLAWEGSNTTARMAMKCDCDFE